MKKIFWIIASLSIILLFLSIWFFLRERAPEPPETTIRQTTEISSSDKNLAIWGFEFPPEKDMAAPELQVESLDGTVIGLEDYHGQILILNFWATWCPPCREEIPSMERMMEELKGTGISMLAVSTKEERAKVEDFVSQQNMTLPVALDESGVTSNNYGLRSVPSTYLINGEGNFIARKVGALNWDNPDLIKELKALE